MRPINAREMSFLEGELNLWLEETIISEEQLAEIKGLYTVKRRPLPLLLLEAGAALLALGGVSFVAANSGRCCLWAYMLRRFKRNHLIGTVLILTVLAGFTFCGRNSFAGIGLG